MRALKLIGLVLALAFVILPVVAGAGDILNSAWSLPGSENPDVQFLCPVGPCESGSGNFEVWRNGNYIGQWEEVVSVNNGEYYGVKTSEDVMEVYDSSGNYLTTLTRILQ